jgi:DNA-binding transcriptional ArsR family regulator
VIRIVLGATGLAQTRFAISPLHAAAELLYFQARFPHAIGRDWRAAAGEALRGGGLDLLTLLARDGAHGYMPDFLLPEPAGYESDPDTELHQVAVTPAARIGYETHNLRDGAPWCGSGPSGRRSAALLTAIGRGERFLAERAASQLAQFWQAVLAARWPRIRARLEDDIAHRTRVMGRDGFAAMATGLHPALGWARGGLDLQMTHYHGLATAQSMILVPAAFGHLPFNVIDPAQAPGRRAPLISYPAMTGAPITAPALDDLIGPTRALLLADLAAPRTTEQLAQRLHLSPSTVSYHLQVLYRAGVVFRTRRSRHVYYHSGSAAPAILSVPQEAAR